MESKLQQKFHCRICYFSFSDKFCTRCRIFIQLHEFLFFFASWQIFLIGFLWFILLTSWDCLTCWGRVTHVCVSKLTIIGSDDRLLPGRRQAIIWTSAGMLSIGPLGTKKNDVFKMAAILSQPESVNWRWGNHRIDYYPSANEVTLKDMGKTKCCQTITRQSKEWKMCTMIWINHVLVLYCWLCDDIRHAFWYRNAVCFVLYSRGPFYSHGLTLIPAWISMNISNKVWDEIVPQIQWLHCLSLGMDKWFYPTLHNGCNYLSMLGLKLIHVSKHTPEHYVSTVFIYVYVVCICKIFVFNDCWYGIE